MIGLGSDKKTGAVHHYSETTFGHWKVLVMLKLLWIWQFIEPWAMGGLWCNRVFCFYIWIVWSYMARPAFSEEPPCGSFIFTNADGYCLLPSRIKISPQFILPLEGFWYSDFPLRLLHFYITMGSHYPKIVCFFCGQKPTPNGKCHKYFLFLLIFLFYVFLPL